MQFQKATGLKRFETLGDSDLVEERIAGSINMSFLEIVVNYPMGEGIGGAPLGPASPSFLSGYAKPSIGIENEFGRLLLEEGLPGLLLWVSFVVYVLGRSLAEVRRGGGASRGCGWSARRYGLLGC